MIHLKGTTNGYVITKCEVAPDEYYDKFNMELNKWITSLTDALDYNIE